MSKKNNIPALPEVMIRPHIQAALLEDFGTGGDITSRACFLNKENVKAELVARESGRLSGLQAALLTFKEVDSDVEINAQLKEGSDFMPGMVLAEISGSVSSVLSAERVALNYLTHLSAIASYTARAVQIIEQAGSETRIAATRKTMPGLRALQKQAVLHGGGWPHRIATIAPARCTEPRQSALPRAVNRAPSSRARQRPQRTAASPCK